MYNGEVHVSVYKEDRYLAVEHRRGRCVCIWGRLISRRMYNGEVHASVYIKNDWYLADVQPESIRCIDSLASFKLALKEHFKKDK